MVGIQCHIKIFKEVNGFLVVYLLFPVKVVRIKTKQLIKMQKYEDASILRTFCIFKQSSD